MEIWVSPVVQSSDYRSHHYTGNLDWIRYKMTCYIIIYVCSLLYSVCSMSALVTEDTLFTVEV